MLAAAVALSLEQDVQKEASLQAGIDVLMAHWNTGVGNVAAVSLSLGILNEASLPHHVLNGVKNVVALSLATSAVLPLLTPLMACEAARKAADIGARALAQAEASAPQRMHITQEAVNTSPGSVVQLYDEYVVMTGEARHVQLLSTISEAAAALVDPSGVLTNFDETASFPHAQLLAAGRAEIQRRQERVSRLDAINVEYTRLSAELVTEEAALTFSPAKLLSELESLQNGYEDAVDSLDEQRLLFKKAQRPRASPSDREAAKTSLRSAKAIANEADRSLTAKNAELFGHCSAFPELLQTLQQSEGLPRDLVAIFRPGRSLNQYDNREPMQTPSRWTVYRAEFEGRAVALKEYTVGQSEIKTCYKEAALLRRLQHPNIVELDAIFMSEERLYLQMPLYPNGTLAEWCGRVLPDEGLLAATMLQICEALAHVHALNIVHSDVHPSNVLIDRAGRPRLGDFDVSVNLATRCTHKFASKQTAAAGHLTFLAPEVMEGGDATFASDMFALGRTIHEVHCARLHHTHSIRHTEVHDRSPSSGFVPRHSVYRLPGLDPSVVRQGTGAATLGEAGPQPSVLSSALCEAAARGSHLRALLRRDVSIEGHRMCR